MHKLRLNLQELEGVQVLSREEMKQVKGGNMPASHSCCIRGNIGSSNIVMEFDPIQVSSQADCAAAADAKVESGHYTNVHYDTDCDGV
ncbi:hypothetical protein A9P82_07745 [Arachidicoccus ginsenosidimutans]|uniref:hypothetical protein n=1 Tax=Arachidicoccus sp. BS20 TaxID=1850526 RepID=UPI0007F0C107|nr:hypothetical protein [Arachidicoccus sp. BS20]ANI89192.1 hypothetical protein A9P82_07745 [Arachidicoccus sp. BS20]